MHKLNIITTKPWLLPIVTITITADIFSVGKEVLCDHIENWGYQSSKEDYYRILGEGHVVLSTAKHEFFGVAM